ncbi:unnamed protein product [Boreogadus saida]
MYKRLPMASGQRRGKHRRVRRTSHYRSSVGPGARGTGPEMETGAPDPDVPASVRWAPQSRHLNHDPLGRGPGARGLQLLAVPPLNGPSVAY